MTHRKAQDVGRKTGGNHQILGFCRKNTTFIRTRSFPLQIFVDRRKKLMYNDKGAYFKRLTNVNCGRGRMLPTRRRVCAAETFSAA